MMDSDDIIWLRLKGRLFDQSDDIFFCLCYNVPEGFRRQCLMNNVDIFDRITDQLVKYQNDTQNECSFMICRDLKARTGTLPDFVNDDSSDHIPALPNDYSIELPVERASEDKAFNRYGSQLLDFCKHTGLRILNGCMGADKGIGKCMFVCSSGKV